MNSRSHRLEKHFVAAMGATASFIALRHHAEGGVVYSSIANIPIPGTFAGVYLNMITGVTGTSASAVPGFDFNPYYGGRILWQGHGLGLGVIGSNGQAAILPPLFLEGGGGGPIGVGPASPFLYNAAVRTDNLDPNTFGVVGVRFLRESDGLTLYGWIRFRKGASNVTPGVILDWAYKDDGSAWVPSPGSLAVLALGLCFRRRKREESA